MATIVHILIALIVAILKAFVAAFALLFSSALAALLGIAGILFVVLLLTGTISVGAFRRSRK